MNKLTFALAVSLLLALVVLAYLVMPGAAQNSLAHLGAEGEADVHFPASETLTEIIFQQGVSPAPSYSGAADTYIYHYEGNSNYGGLDNLNLRYDGVQRILIRFDLSEHIPVNAVVTSAKLALYVYNAANKGVTNYIDAYEVLRPWDEYRATWNQPWEVAGCNGVTDRASERTAQATFSSWPAWQVWENDPLKNLVQRWVSDPSANHGLILIGASPNERQFWYLCSSQYGTDKLLRPKLTVVYYVPAPTPTPTSSPTPSSTPTPTMAITVGQVSGMAWRDENGNGVRDPGEQPMPGVTIVLKDFAYVEIDRRTTLEDGSYSFVGLPSGSYVLTKEDPVGYITTWPRTGTYAFYLPAGTQLTGLDFGFAPLPTATPTPTQTSTPVQTPTQTPTQTPSPTFTPTKTPTSTPTQTAVATATPTGTPPATPTQTSTATPTVTLVPTPTSTPSGTIQDPIPVFCDGLYSGNTVGHPAVIQSYGDCGAGMVGPEVVYAFQAAYAMDYLSISLDTAADLTLFLLYNADPQSCFNTGGSVIVSAVPAGTVYYVIVDGFEAGSYSLAIHCHPPPAYTPTPTLTPTITPTSSPFPTPTCTPTRGGPSTMYLPLVYKPRIDILVDCGAESDYIDSVGQRWSADKPYALGSWGYVGESSVFAYFRNISNTNDPTLYQTARWAMAAFGYQFDVPNGTYEVELHFAELYFRSMGRRLFEVIIEGQTKLRDFDIVAAAGGAFIAHVRTFEVVVRDGQLNVDFVRGSADYPMINALRVTKK